jgi:GrpB-like predicted nucleotidyltransferase (UPF0157 family)
LAAEYAALKRDLAERLAGDREGYTAAKTAFVARAVDLWSRSRVRKFCAFSGCPIRA